MHIVPDALALAESDEVCFAMDADQQLVGTSAAGFLWLVQGMGQSGPVRFEVVDPWDIDAVRTPIELDLGVVQRVSPLSADEALIVATDSLWHLDDWSRVQFTPPSTFTGDAASCGNLRQGGMLLTGGRLVERRNDGWWGLTVDEVPERTPDRLVSVDGECTGPADETWMTAPDGTIWRVSADAMVSHASLTALEAAAATGDTLAVLNGAELWLGPDQWSRWSFEAGAPSGLAAADDRIWVTLGERIVQMRDREFTELEHSVDGAVTHVLADWDGLWISDGTTTCRHSFGPRFRLEGVHPYLRTSQAEQGLTIKAESPDTSITVTVDGEPVVLSSGEEEGSLTGIIVFDELGWTRVDVAAEGANEQTSQRSLWLRRDVPAEVSFVDDIAPIADEHCSGEACHGPMNAASLPVLETYEAWIELADEIERRVVELDNMPPAGARSESWGTQEVETIAKWLEGGMLP
ncbi:MAG: hypothetical protein AAGF11_25775 [Myxococcota bacterium]